FDRSGGKRGSKAWEECRTRLAQAKWHRWLAGKLRATTRRLARGVLDRGFEGLCVKGRHTLDSPQTLGRVPDGEREHRLLIRGIDDVDEIVVALRVMDRLDLNRSEEHTSELQSRVDLVCRLL